MCHHGKYCHTHCSLHKQFCCTEMCRNSAHVSRLNMAAFCVRVIYIYAPPSFPVAITLASVVLISSPLSYEWNTQQFDALIKPNGLNVLLFTLADSGWQPAQRAAALFSTSHNVTELRPCEERHLSATQWDGALLLSTVRTCLSVQLQIKLCQLHLLLEWVTDTYP